MAHTKYNLNSKRKQGLAIALLMLMFDTVLSYDVHHLDILDDDSLDLTEGERLPETGRASSPHPEGYDTSSSLPEVDQNIDYSGSYYGYPYKAGFSYPYRYNGVLMTHRSQNKKVTLLSDQALAISLPTNNGIHLNGDVCFSVSSSFPTSKEFEFDIILTENMEVGTPPEENKKTIIYSFSYDRNNYIYLRFAQLFVPGSEKPVTNFKQFSMHCGKTCDDKFHPCLILKRLGYVKGTKKEIADVSFKICLMWRPSISEGSTIDLLVDTPLQTAKRIETPPFDVKKIYAITRSVANVHYFRIPDPEMSGIDSCKSPYLFGPMNE